MEIISTVFFFILTIGILVLVHELGHFAAAKFFGMRVERFSIGFPPRAFGKKIGDTDYCVSWIPIGGYVKISGMIDESFDTEFVGKPPEPWEFRSKPLWQRAIVLVGGVFMNLLLAVGIFWGLIYSDGKEVWPTTTIGYVMEKSPAANAGFQHGDKVLTINSRTIEYWEEIETFIYVEQMGEDLEVRILRNGSEQTLSIPRTDIPTISEARFGILPVDVVPVVASVDPAKPAVGIGILPGDIITHINEEQIDYYTLPLTVSKFPETPINVRWRRGEEAMESSVTPTDEGRIGISLTPRYDGPVDRMQFSFLMAGAEAVSDLAGAVRTFFVNIKAIVIGTVSLSESVGGPVRIAQIANRSAQAGLASFLTVMAWLSMTLAILNLLPFPALDGGHLAFLAYEGVFRKEIPPKVKIALQQTGFALLLVFMAFVLYNDIVNF